MDTVDLVQELVEEIVNRDKKPLIFVDLERVNLSRDGSIAIMQVLVPPNPTVYLIDVHVLKGAAFETATADGHTWKAILESTSYAKVFFDVRTVNRCVSLPLTCVPTLPRDQRSSKACSVLWVTVQAVEAYMSRWENPLFLLLMF